MFSLKEWALFDGRRCHEVEKIVERCFSDVADAEQATASVRHYFESVKLATLKACDICMALAHD